MPARTKREPEILDPEDPLVISEAETLPKPALVQQTAELMLMPVMDLQLAKARLAEFQQFVGEYMKKGEDYGEIPGIEKPSLFQPGADKLSELYGLAPTFPDERTIRNVDWSMTPPLFDYEVTCVLLSKRTGMVVSEGKGSCSSYEAKYRWRDSKRTCTSCGQATIIKGKAEYGGGWLCWAKKGGCGAKYAEGDQSIEGQPVGRIPNEDIADIKNTILKMAQKRAKIAAVLCATRSSGVFTQDVEDMAGMSDADVAAKNEGVPLEGSLTDFLAVAGDLWMYIDGRPLVARNKDRKTFEGLEKEMVRLVALEKLDKSKKKFFEYKGNLHVVSLENVPF